MPKSTGADTDDTLNRPSQNETAAIASLLSLASQPSNASNPRTRSVARNELATQDTQLSDAAIEERKFYDMLLLQIISSTEVRIGNTVFKLDKPITRDIMAPNADEQTPQGLDFFDINSTTNSSLYPNIGIYFILLQTIGGKWKILYGKSEGNKDKDGLYQRICDHMSLQDVLGEVLTVSIPQVHVAACETMLKMSLLDLRPPTSRGTEIAVFNNRGEALRCISTYQGCLSKFTKRSSIPANYKDIEGSGVLTLQNYKSGEVNNARFKAALKRLPSGFDLLNESRRQKRASFDKMNIDERIQYIQDEIKAQVEALPVNHTPQDIWDCHRNVCNNGYGPIPEWLRKLRETNLEGLNDQQQETIQSEPINLCVNEAQRAKMLNAKVVKNRRVVLTEWQDYGKKTRPPRTGQKKLGKGLPKKFLDLGSAIQLDILAFRYHATPASLSDKKKKYHIVSEDMIALYLEFGLVEFKDATSKENPSLITAAQLEAAKDSIRASDEEKGLRRGPKRGSTSDEPASESDEDERPNKRLRSASSTKTAKPASTRSTRGSPKKVSSSSKKKAKSPTAGKKWSEEEDQKLLKAVEKYNKGYWSLFVRANLIPGRDNLQMSARWSNLETERAEKQAKKRIKLGKKVGYYSR